MILLSVHLNSYMLTHIDSNSNREIGSTFETMLIFWLHHKHVTLHSKGDTHKFIHVLIEIWKFKIVSLFKKRHGIQLIMKLKIEQIKEKSRITINNKKSHYSKLLQSWVLYAAITKNESSKQWHGNWCLKLDQTLQFSDK